MMPFFPSIGVLKGVPALLASLVMAGFALFLMRVNPAEVRRGYLQAAGKAMAEKKYDVARVAYQRLITLEDGSNFEAVFGLSIAMEALGRTGEASALLGMIAPIEKPRYAPAHLAVAKALVKDGKLAPEKAGLFELHLRHAIALEPGSVEANEILGRYYFQKKDWALARKHLKAAVSADPNLMFMLVEACKQTMDAVGVRVWAERAADYWQKEMEVKNSENPTARLSLANALILLERYSEAMNVIEEGDRISHAPVYRLALAETCAVWAGEIARKNAGNLVLRVRLIQKGLQANPKNTQLLELLFEISHCLEGREGIGVRDALAKIQAEGGASAILHFVAGNDALKRGDEEMARKHFELAYDLDPQMPAVANNLAMLMIRGTPSPQPTLALGVIQSAVDKMPADPYLRDTRGQIFVKLGRWKEAVKDLEFALPQLESKGPIHAALAEAYSGLGMQDLAEEHRRLGKAESGK